MAEQRDGASLYKDTLNLPVTTFPMRPNSKIDDPALIERWHQEGLYQRAMEYNAGKTTYILHDGPPYANGHIHLGHAYNKILKDIITKAYRMAGYHVPVTPGWDCHGLPIELKVVKELSDKSPVAVKRACRIAAQEWINVQREEFKRLGVIMDWDNPYITMSFPYEAATLRAFADCCQKGFIARKHKTVAWCPSCETTLASAEIEYAERKDPSVYVMFPLTQEATAKLGYAGKSLGMLVWTTTPWTLPLNRAVAVKPATEYAIVRHGDRLIIVGAQLVAALGALVKQDLEIVAKLSSEQFAGLQLQHPFIAGQTLPVIYDEAVGTDEGTACVHIAPGCGPADYELGVKQGLEIYSPVSSDGKYTREILPNDLAGMSVADGQGWVIRALEAAGNLFYKGSIRHSYPHCWRCHGGLIFRATKQWFFDLKHEDLQKHALEAIKSMKFIPEAGEKSLTATVGSRWEWCISRQRIWGVPIPALICTQCDTAFLTPELVERVAKGVAHEGVEYWDTIAPDVIAAGATCSSCKGSSWQKGADILDVWFDSGVSHYAVLNTHVPKRFPADIYVEGSDQYRGWFQSSLLTSMAIEGVPAMRTIMTHGYTVDEHGRKMSKSLGNGVEPQQIYDRLGTDGLRLWVATIGHESDVVVSEVLLKNVEQVYRKIRNTCRFMLQNLYDFDHTKDLVSTDKLLLLDACALTDFAHFHERMREAYKAGDFTAVFHGLSDYCTTELSAVYFDVIKDRLYVELADGFPRRSAQSVIWRMLDAMTRLIAPILSFTAEYIADAYQHPWSDSVHLQSFASYAELLSTERATEQQEIWEMVREIRDTVMKLLEEQRAKGLIKHPLEAQVTLYVSEQYAHADRWKRLQGLVREGAHPTTVEALLEEVCVVSSIVVATSDADLQVTAVAGIVGSVITAPGVKCPRCWRWQQSKHADGLCDRCDKVVAHYR